MSVIAWLNSKRPPGTHLPGSRVVAAAVLAGLAALAGVLLLAAWVAGPAIRPLRSTGGLSTLLAAWIIAAPLLAIAGLAIRHLWLARRRMVAGVDAMVRSAERLTGGELGVRTPVGHTDPELRALSGALNRLAELHEATSAVLLDRDAQLGALRSLAGAIYWETDADGRYTRIELPPQGRRPEIAQLLGRHRWDELAVPADGSPWDAHRALLQRRERFTDFVVQRRAFGGEPFFVSENGQPRTDAGGHPTGYVGVMREVTREVLEQRDRRLALASLRATVEPTLLIETATGAPGWRVTWANQAACRLFDRLESDLLTLSPALLFAVPGSAELIGTAMRDRTGLKQAVQLRTRYSETRTATMRFDPILDRDGNCTSGALLFDDLGPEVERLSAEVAMAEQLRRDAALRSLDLEVTAKELESFSYTVSHDLRAPLRVVEGFANVIREDYGHTLDRIGNEHLNRILSAAHRMNSMIDALLALSSLSAKPVVAEEVDLSRLAAAVADELRAAHPEHAIVLTIQPGLTVRGDPMLLRVVLANLLGNAWKYSARSARPEITLSGDGAADPVVFCVRDNGVGFDMRFADRLFGVFQRLHSASEFPGTGVGLATVQRIIRRHGGRVWAQSEPGAGARFYFTLWEPTSSRPSGAARRTQ